jgi:phosphoserine phosphatase
VVITVPKGRDLLKELLLFGWEERVDVDFEVVDSLPTTSNRRHVITVLAPDLGPAEIGEVAGAIANGGGNIDRIVRMSRYPVVSYEMIVSGGDIEVIRRELVAFATEHSVDIAVQRDGLARRAARLVVLDVDSTLISDEVIDLLAEKAGHRDEVAEVTARAMAGELDFETSLRQRVKLLAGLEESAIEQAARQMKLTPGARTFVRTLHRLGYTVALVSGGFEQFTERLRHELGIAHAHANRLEAIDGRLTGELEGPIVDRERKAQLLQDIASAEGIPLDQTVAVGDGANDLDMLSLAGLGIAFNAKQVVRDAADTALSVPYLDAVLFVLGVRREDVEDADADAGMNVEAPPV